MIRFLVVAVVAASSSAAEAQGVTVTLSEWKVGLSRDTVKAGPVTFRVSNSGSMNHAFFVHGTDLDEGTREIGKGESATLRVTLKPGTYDVYCPMSDLSHKKAGMARTIVVMTADAPAAAKKPGG